jgi:hypothetical protein
MSQLYKYLSIGVITLTSLGVFGQSYNKYVIWEKADSILEANIGDSLFHQFERHFFSMYFYKTPMKEFNTGFVNDDPFTRGELLYLKLQYQITIPYPQCPIFDPIVRIVTLELGSNLELKELHNMDYLPDYYWIKDTCHFIDRDSAVTIANRSALKPSESEWNGSLFYNPQGVSAWKLWRPVSKTETIQSELPKKKKKRNKGHSSIPGSYEVERCDIDATTGIIVSHGMNTVYPRY